MDINAADSASLAAALPSHVNWRVVHLGHAWRTSSDDLRGHIGLNEMKNIRNFLCIFDVINAE
jgi:hypothetical protein